MHQTAATLDPSDRDLLRLALAAAERAKAAGRHPFGAIVADEHGNVVAEAGNNAMPPEGDPTQHAERLAAAQAAQTLSPEQLARCTLYTSAEPCAMCAGAIYWCNIGRVVYAMSEEKLLELTGSHPENPTLSLPCRQVFASGQRATVVVGPVPEMEQEAAAPHAGFWELR
jgi:tRNA(Arg) A34 adenosine deaminase TadA